MSHSTFDDDFGPIRDRFLKLLVSRHDSIVNELDAALNDPQNAVEALRAIEAVLHKIAGSAGTLGFDKLGRLARAIEYDIREACQSGDTDFAGIYQAIIAYLEYAMTLTDSE